MQSTAKKLVALRYKEYMMKQLQLILDVASLVLSYLEQVWYIIKYYWRNKKARASVY